MIWISGIVSPTRKYLASRRHKHIFLFCFPVRFVRGFNERKVFAKPLNRSISWPIIRCLSIYAWNAAELNLGSCGNQVPLRCHRL